MQFYEKLQILRKQAGWTQSGLAEKMNVSRQAISKWESGTAYPDLTKIAEICLLFNVDPCSLIDPKTDQIHPLDQSVSPFDPILLGANLRRVRSARGMGQEMLAELLGVSRQTVSKWETGTSVPKTEVILILRDALNTSIYELFYQPKENDAQDSAASSKKGKSRQGHRKPNTTPPSLAQADPPCPQDSPADTPKQEKAPPAPTSIPLEEAINREESSSPAWMNLAKEDLTQKPPQAPVAICPSQEERSLWRTVIALTSLSLVIILSLALLIPRLIRSSQGDSIRPPSTQETPLQSTPQAPNTPSIEPEKNLPWNGTVDLSWYRAEEDRFVIKTAEELAGLAQLVNMGVDSFEGKTIHLKNDIDLGSNIDLQWIPIGGGSSRIAVQGSQADLLAQSPDLELTLENGIYYYPAYFGGNFEGEGHTISGLYLETTQDRVGLFGSIRGGSVKDLTLKIQVLVGSNQVGAICGRLSPRSDSNAQVTNCHVLMNEKLIGNENVGGICGTILAIDNTVTFRQCSISGSIGGLYNVGGAVGQGRSEGISSLLLFEEIHGIAKIFRYDATFQPDDLNPTGGNFGGIAGALMIYEGSRLEISRCQNSGDLCREQNVCTVGGIVGGIETKPTTPLDKDMTNGSALITNCKNTGSLCSGSKRSDCVGGIAGFAQFTAIEISYCYVEADITARYECGGICGFFRGDDGGAILHCIFAGSIQSTMDKVPSWIIKEPEWQSSFSEHKIGGILGYYSHLGAFDATPLENCYVSGSITAQFKGGLIGASRVGHGMISDCAFDKNAAAQAFSHVMELTEQNCTACTTTELAELIEKELLLWDDQVWRVQQTVPHLIGIQP